MIRRISDQMDHTLDVMALVPRPTGSWRKAFAVEKKQKGELQLSKHPNLQLAK